MDYKPGDIVYAEFTTRVFATGVSTDADSTPTGTVNKNGTDDGAVTVTVTKIDTGRYKAVFTIPTTYVAGDVLNLTIAATVSTIADKAAIWNGRVGVGIIRSAAAAAGAAGTITLDGSASTTLDFYKGTWITIISGTGAGQTRFCSTYSTGRVATVVPNWVTTPDTTSIFVILPAAGVDVEQWLATNAATPATAGIPDVNVKNINNVAAATPGASGGILIAGSNAATTFANLTVSGTSAFGAITATTITASGAVAFQSTFAVTTSTSLGALSCTTLTASGAVTFQSTFAVTGTTTLGGLSCGAFSCTTLTASGAVAFQSTFAVTTSTSLAALSCTTLTASGAVAFQSTFTVTGAVAFSSNFTTVGTFQAGTVVTGDVQVGNVFVTSLAVSGATTLTGAVTATNAGNDIRGVTIGGTFDTYTFPEWMRLVGSVICGTASGGPSGTVFNSMGGSTVRVTSIDDANGNRTSVVLTP